MMLTLLSYIPASNKIVILFSWQHHDNTCMGEAQDHKLEIIIHYNDKLKWGWHPRQACDRIYLYEINKALSFEALTSNTLSL